MNMLVSIFKASSWRSLMFSTKKHMMLSEDRVMMIVSVRSIWPMSSPVRLRISLIRL